MNTVEEYKVRKSTVDDIAKLVRERGSVDLADLSEYWNGKAGGLFSTAAGEEGERVACSLGSSSLEAVDAMSAFCHAVLMAYKTGAVPYEED